MNNQPGGVLITLILFLLAAFPTAAGLRAQELSGTYKSRHKFMIRYPAGFRVVPVIDKYDTLEEAVRAGGNYFEIMSYAPDDARIKSANIFPRDTLKIKAWIYPEYYDTLAVLITQTRDISRIGKFTIDGKKARKVWQDTDRTALGDELYSIFFVDADKKMKVVFVCYPTYTSLTEEFEEIVGSFRFTGY